MNPVWFVHSRSDGVRRSALGAATSRASVMDDQAPKGIEIAEGPSLEDFIRGSCNSYFGTGGLE